MLSTQTFEDRLFSKKEIEKTNSLAWAHWLSNYQSLPRLVDTSGLTLAVFLSNSKKLVQAAFKAIQNGTYEPFPAVLTTIFADKERLFMRPAWIDKWILAHIGRLYSEMSEPLLHSRVFSYRQGRGQHIALKEFAAYAQQHKSISVLRTDIADYGETLKHTYVIEDFAEVTRSRDIALRLFQVLCRYPFLVDGNVSYLIQGLPMGSHLQLVAENLYLRTLDDRLSRFEGSFYARFGDDIVAAHPDIEVVSHMEKSLVNEVCARGLGVNVEKTARIRLCGPHNPVRDSEAYAASISCKVAARYLGKEVTFDGRLLAPSSKVRLIYSQLSAWLTGFAERLPNHLSRDERTKLLCRALTSFLVGTSATHTSRIHHFLGEIADPKQLSSLDRRLCELLVGLVLKKPFRKGFFRELPPRKLRDSGFEALIHLRRVGKL